MKAIILAGGSGERFWPFSTKDTPKQFLELFDGKSLIRQTFDRLRRFIEPEDIYVVTSGDHVDRTLEELPGIPKENIIGEPMRRNTAPACFLGALAAGPKNIQLVVPADHRIQNPDQFWKCVETAENSVKLNGGLITFGIQPTRPETGYGYIEAAKEHNGVFRVISFREKPDRETAISFMKNGNLYWNSGIFVWRGADLISEIRKTSPSLFRGLDGADPYDMLDLESRYGALEPISIDYAVMERSREVWMVPGKFSWSDVGSWTSMRELEGYTSDHILIDCQRVFVKSTTGRTIGVLGMEDLIVIDTDEGLLICRDGDSQRVKEITKKLRS